MKPHKTGALVKIECCYPIFTDEWTDGVYCWERCPLCGIEEVRIVEPKQAKKHENQESKDIQCKTKDAAWVGVVSDWPELQPWQAGA